MKLSEALDVIHHAPASEPPYRVALACGYTPLHLQTFLSAHLQQRLAARTVVVQPGLYGDLDGTLRRALREPVHAVVVTLEWPDLDPRLGYRSLGGWGPAEENAICGQVRIRLQEWHKLIEEIALEKTVALALPTLPLPPAFHPPGWQLGATEAALWAQLCAFAARLAEQRNVLIANPPWLSRESPLDGRFDLKSELLTGLPYTLPHASRLAETLARMLVPPPPKKGLITDLDDTLWRGLAGEVGAEGVSWDLPGHAQIHGLYQQTLRALADQGVLIAIASKNDPAVVQQVLQRSDLLLPPDRIFPLEVHWRAKSGSVERILRAWNIAADAAVFVDDSPMELAEVQAAFPGLQCLPFPGRDYVAAEGFLRQLRDLFGKPHLSPEDALRQQSLRNAAVFSEQLEGAAASDDFLKGLQATLSVDPEAAADPRALELVNKTNQFNLNGRRFDTAEWLMAANQPGAFVWSIAYQDKFGPLGKIAILQGRRENGVMRLDTWVMSCRAFARRIEHQCLRLLFEHSGAEQIELKFQPTGRNSPLQEFLAELLPQPICQPARIRREDFLSECPPLFQSIQWKQK